MRRVWTYETIMEEAAKHETLQSFIEAAKGAYNKASKEGWLDELSRRLRKHPNFLTKEEAISRCQQFTAIRDLRENDKVAYNAAIRMGVQEEAFKGLENGREKWTLATTRAAAAPFPSQQQFKRALPGAFKAAIKNGWLNEICAHMIYDVEHWTVEKAKARVLERDYATRNEVKENDPRLYDAVYSHGWADDVFGHIPISFQLWTLEKVLEAAEPFETIRDFRDACPKAYDAAVTNKWLKHIRQRLKRGSTGFNPDKAGIVYYIRIEHVVYGRLYKVGVTNYTVADRFEGERLNLKEIKVWRFDDGEDALKMERQLLSDHKADKFDGDKVLRNGNTELFPRDVLGLDRNGY